MGPGGFDGAYNENAPVEDYYFEDPSLYDDYIPFGEEYEAYELGGGSGSGSGSGTTYDGSNNADTMDKSTETAAWTFNGFSGNDTFIGGSGNDVFWGAVGNDTLTGNTGSDTFYYGDNTEGTDTITDFNSSGDVLKFAQPFSSAYTRTSYATDAGATGTTYNIAANGNTLPKVINFTTDNSHYASSSQTAAFFNTLSVTTDGSTPISGSESFIIVTGDGNHSAVYGWTDSGDGNISGGELFSLAILANVDNDNLSAANFSFGVI